MMGIEDAIAHHLVLKAIDKILSADDYESGMLFSERVRHEACNMIYPAKCRIEDMEYAASSSLGQSYEREQRIRHYISNHCREFSG